MPKQYSDEFKREMIILFQDGMPISEINKNYRIAPSTVYRWAKEYNTDGEMKAASNYQALLHKKERLDHIVEIIRLSGIINEVPLQKRLDILETIHNQHEEYSIHELCEALSVARGTFYNRIFRKADRAQYMKEQQELMLRVQQIFDDSQQRFGAEKIRIILGENGIHVGKKRIRDIMQELGLESIRENAKKDYKKRQEYKRKNLLNQNFLVTSTFREAFQSRNSPQNLTFHSDRGGQYVSGAFCTLLRKCGVKQSFSKSGCPHDNAVAETFFATFKKEEAYRRDYSSEADFRKSVGNYIDFYNNVRPHQTLAYKSPTRFEELYGK